MSPEEVVKNLDSYGIKISRDRLTRWARIGAISQPRRGSNGRGKGRWTDYPDKVIPEVMAVHRMLTFCGYSLDWIVAARQKYTEVLSNNNLINDFNASIQSMADKAVKGEEQSVPEWVKQVCSWRLYTAMAKDYIKAKDYTKPWTANKKAAL